jgi:hydrogenase expression/formation protein HypC
MRIVEIDGPAKALVESGGVSRRVDVSLVDNPAPGDYVIVHAGFAIEKLDRLEADARLELFEEMARLEREDSGGGG